MDKLDFLALYPEAHKITFSEQNIQSGFRATGLIPHAPYEVLSKLSIKTPSPPGTSHGSQGSWTPQTSKNLIEIQKQSNKF